MSEVKNLCILHTTLEFAFQILDLLRSTSLNSAHTYKLVESLEYLLTIHKMLYLLQILE